MFGQILNVQVRLSSATDHSLAKPLRSSWRCASTPTRGSYWKAAGQKQAKLANTFVASGEETFPIRMIRSPAARACRGSMVALNDTSAAARINCRRERYGLGMVGLPG